jgi:integrase
MISQGSRPKQTPKSDRRWLEDDAMVRRIFDALPAPFDLMFYIGNRCGLRLGEIAGMRLSDLDWLHEEEPVLRVMYQYDGEPLKEDKDGQAKKVKWPPVPPDAVAMLDQARAVREGEGAGADALLWPCPTRQEENGTEHCYRKELIEHRWEKAIAALAKDLPALAGLTFYSATRHSFVSRNLKADVPLQTVSEAVGHSSPAVTQRFYNHYVRKSYPTAMRGGLELGAKKAGGEVVQLRPKKPARCSAEFSAGVDKQAAEK